jgi:RNA polymerase sigma factor (sigma-70 family)
MWISQAVPVASLASSAVSDGGLLPLPKQVSLGQALVDHAQREVSELYSESAAEFLNYALATIHDEELARDAMQEGFIRYFVARCNGEQVAIPRAWIYRVIRNYLLDRMKEARGRVEQRLEEARACPDRKQDIEGNYFRSEVLALVETTLTPRELQCFRLRSEGLHYDEIASALKLRSGTVGALISRAVRKIRAAIGRRGELAW